MQNAVSIKQTRLVELSEEQLQEIDGGGLVSFFCAMFVGAVIESVITETTGKSLSEHVTDFARYVENCVIDVANALGYE